MKRLIITLSFLCLLSACGTDSNATQNTTTDTSSVNDSTQTGSTDAANSSPTQDADGNYSIQSGEEAPGFSVSDSSLSATRNGSLETTLQADSRIAYIHEINGFYIIATHEPVQNVDPSTVTTKAVFDQAVHLFSSFLDQDNDGNVDTSRTALANALAKGMLFAIGNIDTLESMESLWNEHNLYMISMNSDQYPFRSAFTGLGWTFIPAVNTASTALDSSQWRPPETNALWEEAFHTLTEAANRYDSTMKFAAGTQLQNLMNADIDNSAYEIQNQNNSEAGFYDRITAVNEYIYQIWTINFAGYKEQHLTNNQQAALTVLTNANIPLTVTPNYTPTSGTAVGTEIYNTN